jgi:protein-S-isoprenylcysteine O-methyltransferase Ste14
VQACDTAGVIAPPPVILAAMLAAGFLLDWLAPWPVSGGGGRDAQTWVGWALIVGALAVAMTAVRQFRRAGTNIPTYRPTTALVTGGLYRWSRNPIYTAMIALQLGAALAADNLWLTILGMPLALVLRYGIIAREERYLAAKFGPTYHAYRQSVRRWI